MNLYFVVFADKANGIVTKLQVVLALSEDAAILKAAKNDPAVLQDMEPFVRPFKS